MSEFRLLQTQVETLETIFQDLEKYTHDQGDSSNLSLAIEKRQALEKLQSEIQGETGVLVEKFRARCTMVDPVTNEPRFGPKMLSKVQDILRHFDSIKTRLETSDIIEKIIYKAVLQQQQIDFEKKKKQEIQDQKEQEKIANLKKQQEEKRLAMEQAQTLQFLEEEKEKKRIEALAIVAQQKRKTKKHLRQLEKQQQEEKQRALQEQIDLLNTSVPLGKEGLQQALDLLQTNIPSKVRSIIIISLFYTYVHNCNTW
jgi:flagellar biosynthesis GTPase FlhF